VKLLDRSVLGLRGEIPCLEAPRMARIPWIRHGFLTRQGGGNAGNTDGSPSMETARNRSVIAKAFGFESDQLATVRQVHRDGILVLEEPYLPSSSPIEYDALVTDVPNLFLGIRTADCLPILIADRNRRVIAAIHAGRSGTALQIAAKTLRTMKERFGCSSEDLQIAMGPFIGPCCYEIDQKVYKAEWAPFSIPSGEARWRIDLAAINLAQVEQEGVPRCQVERFDLCTRCNSDLFFSYRKDGGRKTGTQLSLIGMNGTARGGPF
jgi:polyphenol oxidase